MCDSNVQPLQKISTEVVESQFKIILSSQCIKAQAYLVEKLRKQSEQTKQICTFISNGNFKLEDEIRLGELQVQSLLSALETIKSANVELKKELLLAIEEKNDLAERVNSGIKKYEELWVTSKKRYDNMPLIKEKLEIENKGIALKNNINSLGCEIQNLFKALDTRKNELISLDKKNIINIAEYMTHERPKLLQYAKEKKEEIDNLQREINKLEYEQEVNRNPLKQVIDITMYEATYDSENSTKNKNNESNETVLLPKLQLQNIDLDILTDKLKQIKKADADSSLIKRVDSVSEIRKNDLENNIFLSSNLKTSINDDKKKDTYQAINYSEKKLIHILEDIQLHKKETFNIFSKLNPNDFHDVNTIKAEFDLNKSQQSKEKSDHSLELDQNEVIEEVDLTIKDSSSIVLPPTQFLDLSQGDLPKKSQKCDEVPMEVDTPQEDCSITKNSQERRVTFDIASVQDVDTNHINITQDEVTSNQLNTCSGNEHTYNKIKENIFKKHNIELSPEFTYSKNPVVPKVYNTSVTSKFFDLTNNTKNQEFMDINTKATISEVTGPQENINVDGKQIRNPSVAGFLFTHGSKGLPESLDMSIASTCIDESDEFSHCIDSTLLLSPKADVVMSASGDANAKGLSQEVPNFLSGFKKVGLSFFGNSSSEKKSDSNNKNLNTDFNFNFGSTEKKSRGGLFNMFN